MKMHLILCPVDYSGSSEPAIHLATDLARANHSKIVLLNVIESGRSSLSSEEAEIKQFHDRLLDQHLTQHGIKFEHMTRHGDPADQTIELANQLKADLIVMGTHGRTGLTSVVAGSVAKSVMA